MRKKKESEFDEFDFYTGNEVKNQLNKKNLSSYELDELFLVAG